jgi:hypothetical protein
LRSFAWFTRFSTPCTRFGNQGILVRRAFYEALGGFPEWPLFEDVELLRRARAVTRIHVLRGFVTAAAQRFHERGTVRTLWLNARLLARLAAGTPTSELADRYFAPVVPKAARTTIATETPQTRPASPPTVVPAKLA